MKVGDLVRYVPTIGRWGKAWHDHRGIVIRSVAGTERIKVILWMDGTQQGIPERNLEVVND